jgi:cysteine desulfurase/selenocysteine lyase
MPPTAPPSLRGDFPALAREINGHPLAYLDNAASTQKPRAVLDAMAAFYERHNANTHSGVHTLSEEATARYEEARARVARFLGAPAPERIVFTGGTTEAINLVAQGWGRAHLRPGEEIVLTAMEHHSNLLPWQRLAAETGARLRYLELGPDGLLAAESLETAVRERTRLVAVTHASNVLGSINPVARLAAQAREVGARVLVDAAQSAAHLPLDVAALDCDFLAFSAHKVYGPTGIGVLYGRPELLACMEPVRLGGGMVLRVGREDAQWMAPPWRFEGGTPPIAEAVGLAAALDYLEGLERTGWRREEAALTAYALEALADLPDVTVYGPPAEARVGVVSFSLRGVHPHDVAQVLDSRGVAVRGGHHCCQPLMEVLGQSAVVRASLGLYNGRGDIDRLVEGLHATRKLFGRGGFGPGGSGHGG